MLTPKKISTRASKELVWLSILIRKSKPVKMRYKYVIPTFCADRNKNNIRKGLISSQKPGLLSLEIRLVPLRNQRKDYLP